ncbi:hypothetical protein B0H11DRAFT_1917747 [Mycena galericulata]|nr:hypothetical protein B0H11DRAFT_1917747 [Mycena galericulata]
MVRRSDTVAHPIWTGIGAQETGVGGGIGQDRAGSARSVNYGGKGMGGGYETTRSRGSSSRGPGTAGIGGGGRVRGAVNGSRREKKLASAARAAAVCGGGRWRAGQRGWAGGREGAEKEGEVDTLSDACGGKRPSGKRGNQWNRGHRGCNIRSKGSRARAAAAGGIRGKQETMAGQRAAGPGRRQRTDVECCVINGKRRIPRRGVWGKQRGRGARFGGGQTGAEGPDQGGQDG